MNKWENSTDQILQHVKQLLEQLPLEVQQAFNLLINNLDIIDELLCDAMTLETKESYVEDALQREAAEALAALFGTEPRHNGGVYDAYEVDDRQGKTWKIVSDSSIRAIRRNAGRRVPAGEEYRVEMNSPKLEYAEMEKLQQVVRTLRRAGAVTNESCGMHVHVDAANHTPQSLKNALSIMYSKEDILFLALKVNEARVERWCQKVREPMLEKIRKMPTNLTMEQLKRL